MLNIRDLRKFQSLFHPEKHDKKMFIDTQTAIIHVVINDIWRAHERLFVMPETKKRRAINILPTEDTHLLV